jgi:hypothetical protein
MGLISNVCVPIFKMIYLPSDTAHAHAGVFIYTLKSHLIQGFPPEQEILLLHIAKTHPC